MAAIDRSCAPWIGARISVLRREAGAARNDSPTKSHAMYSIVMNKYYVDELYDAIIVWPVVADFAGVPVEICRYRD